MNVGHDHAFIVGPGTIDETSDGPLSKAKALGLQVERIVRLRVAHIKGSLSAEEAFQVANKLLVDSVDQWCKLRSDQEVPDDVVMIETGFRPGVTDREGAELVRAASELGVSVEAAAIATRWLVSGHLTKQETAILANGVLHNDVVERWDLGELPAGYTDPSAKASGVAFIALLDANDDELMVVSKQRRLGLDLVEMRAIQEWFAKSDREPTDAELEMLAQTWSEHCSHKTFRGSIKTDNPEIGKVDGLLNSYLRAATDQIAAPWVRSAFVDNAGIVAFDDEWDLAIKAETHNHPSALEPFGGSNTGVGGVVRDILGVSAQPIAITDVLCFGPEDLPRDEVPEGVLHPARIRSGVVLGVGDYGNKLGVPTVAGAIIHHESYTTTPLVFAGCLGILPRGSHCTEPNPGDAIVVLGGAVGRDGVGGATFSSQTMGVETADIAGSSVQIGDPVVEKGLIDVGLAARDAGLYSAITDCGAGGLSSAIGEMAEKLGAVVELDEVPRKYPGLAPWEVWLSEAQERMVFAAPDPEPLLELAKLWQVGASVVGHFSDDGKLVVKDSEETVIDLETKFLHDGRPRSELRAVMPRVNRPERKPVEVNVEEALLGLLAHPSIRSNESVVRTYDHEVLGGTIVRPYGGVKHDAPADGTALIPPGTKGEIAVAIGVGVNALWGVHDAEAMAWQVIDEAVRNVVIAGADPSRLSLLDNFAWGNPNDPKTAGQLVAACKGCHDAAIAHGAPFVSGKDSLYNVFVRPDGTPDPVAPTLMITSLGLVDAVDNVPATGVTSAGNDVWLVGPVSGHLGASHLDDWLGVDNGGLIPPKDPDAVSRHVQMHAAISVGLVRSAHDLSEGGLAVAAAEWALGGRLGLDLSLAADLTPNGQLEVLFGEGSGRYLVEVEAENDDEFAKLVPSAAKAGKVTEGDKVKIGSALEVDLSSIHSAFLGGAE